jgi:spore maturation protein CgeB
MYRVLASSRITINTHIDVAEGFANNLRLYEATGMGALLITDGGSNLASQFDVGREVVTYSSPEDCVEKIEHYVAHPVEAAKIAASGQARTLSDHTWRDRMDRLVTMIQRRL